jgi:hypothetical protein
MKKIIFLLATIAALTSFPKNAKAQSSELKKVAKWLQGGYSSELQSKNDSDYYSISLMIIPIWTKRTDGFWFYVEQAMSTMIDKPYRQRVYHLTEPQAGKFESAIFMLDNPLRFAGKVQDVEALPIDSIHLKEGCSVYLSFNKEKKSYVGGTEGVNCPSDRSGAKYATSIVTLDQGQLLSWDQGFDSENKQVWGATKGGYVFIKNKR